MHPYYKKHGITIYCGDCLTVLPQLKKELATGVVTDPPYGLSITGKQWDHNIPGVLFWEAIHHIAKPGAFLLSFGGTRTYHRLTCAIEDAGWTIRDCMMWLYSSMPKSQDISKRIDKTLGMKRKQIKTKITKKNTQGTGFTTNIVTNLWIEKAREVGYHEHDGPIPVSDLAKLWDGWGTSLNPSWEPIVVAMKPIDDNYAKNVIKHGVGGLAIDRSRMTEHKQKNLGFGIAESNRPISDIESNYHVTKGRWPTNVIHDGSSEVSSLFPNISGGNVSRFFYSCKADSDDRGKGNEHPTVKPIALMKYLCGLILPPENGNILDPFMGSGSTLLACLQLGQNAVGIEKEEKYCEMAAKRIDDFIAKKEEDKDGGALWSKVKKKSKGSK